MNFSFKKYLLESDLPEFNDYFGSSDNDSFGRINFNRILDNLTRVLLNRIRDRNSPEQSEDAINQLIIIRSNIEMALKLGIEMSFANFYPLFLYIIRPVPPIPEDTTDDWEIHRLDLYYICLRGIEAIRAWLRNSANISLNTIFQIQEEIRLVVGNEDNSPFEFDLYYSVMAEINLLNAIISCVGLSDDYYFNIEAVQVIQSLQLVNDRIGTAMNHSNLSITFPYSFVDIERAVRAAMIHNPDISHEPDPYYKENLNKIQQLCSRQEWSEEDLFLALGIAQDILGVTLLESLGNDEGGMPIYNLLLYRLNPIFPRNITGDMEQIANLIDRHNLRNGLVSKIKQIICK